MIRSETDSFLNAVEQHAQKKFLYRNEIGFLWESAQDRKMNPVFEDACFLAKFISNSYNILKRGGQTDETEKLSAEFKDRLEKVSTLIRTLIKESPDEPKQQFVKQFFSLSHDSMNNLLSLLQELSRIKNYFLDQQHQNPSQ